MLLFPCKGAVFPSIPKVREIGGREFVQVDVRSLLRPFQKLTLTEGFQLSSSRVLETARFGVVQELFDGRRDRASLRVWLRLWNDWSGTLSRIRRIGIFNFPNQFLCFCPTTCFCASADKLPAIQRSLDPLRTLAPAPSRVLSLARRVVASVDGQHSVGFLRGRLASPHNSLDGFVVRLLYDC